MATSWGEALARAAKRLREAGIDEARLDAELLLAHVVGLSRTMLRLHAARPLGEADRARYDALIAQRAERVPLPYLVGEQEFYGLALAADARALIPRWDSEVLVERLLAHLPADRPLRLVDVGTGTGALAVALAVHRPRARVWATDLAPDTLALAAVNVARHALAERVELRLGDLAEPLAELNGTVDAVVSNPPYIPTAVIETLAPEVRDHEPRGALDGGADGLDVIRRLAPQVAALLKPGGVVAIECGDDQAAALAAILTEAGLEPLEVLRDLGRRERGVLGRRR